MGLADELSTGMVGQQFGMPFESFGAPAEVPSARARFDARADTAHLIGAGAPRFLLAEHILRGEARAPVAKAQQQQQQMDTRIVIGRQCAIVREWHTNWALGICDFLWAQLLLDLTSA